MNNFGGESLTYWAALVIAASVKWFLSQKATTRQTIGGILSGMFLAYFGHDFVIRNVGFFNSADDVIVSIALVFTGEHLARFLLSLSPEKALKIWRDK